MTDRNDPWPAEFDPVAAVFEEQLQTLKVTGCTFYSTRADQIVDGATYAKMQAVIHATVCLVDAIDCEANPAFWLGHVKAALRALDGA